MTSLLVVLAGLIVPGFVPALALARHTVPALALAPIVTGLFCASGAVLALVTRTALLPWVIVAALGTNVVVVAHQRSSTKGGSSSAGFPFRSWLPVTVVIAPLLSVRQAPHAWDARSIWWFHADWFWAGGASLARALSNEAFKFSHPDYPPLAPATIGTLWRLRSAGDLDFAQLVSAVLTVAPVVVLAMAIGSRFVITVGHRVASVISGMAVVATYGVTKNMGTDGYVDLQWSAAFCAAAVILLLWPPAARHAAIAAVVLAYAALTKNEGTMAAVILLAVAAVRYRAHRRFLVYPALAVATGLAWMIVARLHGAESDLAAGSTVSAWLGGDFAAFNRVSPTLTAVWHVGRITMTTAAITAVLGLVLLRKDRHRLTLPGAGYLWAVTIGVQLLMILAYVISPHPLDWHLASSVTRTMLSVQLLLLAEVVVWIGVALCVLSRAQLRSEPTSPGRPQLAQE